MRYKDKVVLQTYISTDLNEELKKRASLMQISVSSYVRLLLIGALKNDVLEGTNSRITELSSDSRRTEKNYYSFFSFIFVAFV